MLLFSSRRLVHHLWPDSKAMAFLKTDVWLHVFHQCSTDPMGALGCTQLLLKGTCLGFLQDTVA